MFGHTPSHLGPDVPSGPPGTPPVRPDRRIGNNGVLALNEGVLTPSVTGSTLEKSHTETYRECKVKPSVL